MGLNALPIQPGRVLGADRLSVSPSGAGVFGQDFSDVGGEREFRLMLASDETLQDGIGVESKGTSRSDAIVNASLSGALFVGCALVDDNGGAVVGLGEGVLVVTKGRVEAFLDAGVSAGDKLTPTASGSFGTIAAVGDGWVGVAIDAANAGGKVTIELR